MNRRQFTTALSALAATPALPLRAMAAAPAVASVVPNGARFWAIYMSTMHGSCNAKTLSTMTGLDITAAQNCLTSLINDGVITPTRMLSNLGRSQANTTSEPSKWRERVKKFIDEKQPPEPAIEVATEEPEIEEIPNDEDDQA